MDLSESSNSNILQKGNDTFIFEKKILYLYNKKGNLLFEDSENSKFNLIPNITSIINNFVGKFNKIRTTKKSEDININIFFINNVDKIVLLDIGKINIISVGIFSNRTKTIIIKFFLLSFIITFINYLEERTNILINTDKIINNNFYIDIYKSFLFLPFKKYFLFLTRKTFRRQKLKFKNIFYKNYYLIELNSNKIIFSLQSLFNIKNNNGESGSKYQLKIHKKIPIWNEILYHSHKLKKLYMDKYSLNFNENQYQNYYARVELKSTFPRRTFLIEFLPILNGLALIHEYIQVKLTSIKGEEKSYKECESIYGFTDEIKFQNEKNTNNQLIPFKGEPIILKKVNILFMESLFVNIPSTNFFSWKKKKNIYISQEIMNVIDRHLLSKSNSNIIKDIEKDLYKEYVEINKFGNNEFEINSSDNLILKKDNNDNENEDFYDSNERIVNIKGDYSGIISLNIPKKFFLTSLFEKLNMKPINENSITNFYSQKKNNILNDNHCKIKINTNSKNDINRFSEILNDNVSDYIGTSNIGTKYKRDENNNSFNYNIYDSNFIFNNRENSILTEDIFNLDISIIEKNSRKYSNFNYNKNNNETQNNKKNLKSLFDNLHNKSNKNKESFNSKISDLDYLGSKEEFFEGEIKNKVK